MNDAVPVTMLMKMRNPLTCGSLRLLGQGVTRERMPDPMSETERGATLRAPRPRTPPKRGREGDRRGGGAPPRQSAMFNIAWAGSRPLNQFVGVTRSLSRPQVSDDNPFSEAQFKTLKYHPSFPGRFGDQGQAKTFCRSFFRWYNAEHRHDLDANPRAGPLRERRSGHCRQEIRAPRSMGRSSRTLRQRCAEAQTAPGGRLHKSSHPFPHHTGHCSLINPVECPIVVDRFRNNAMNDAVPVTMLMKMRNPLTCGSLRLLGQGVTRERMPDPMGGQRSEPPARELRRSAGGRGIEGGAERPLARAQCSTLRGLAPVR